MIRLSYAIIGFIVFGVLAGSAQATALTTELVADGFSKPVYLTYAPGDSTRLFVLEQHTGRIRIIKNGTVLIRPFLDIGADISTSFERGLLCMAFHPAFPDSACFYINYTNTGGDLTISRYSISVSDPDSADHESESVIMVIPEPEANHNGGTLLFGPDDGYLYIGVGDGGGSGDQHGLIGNGQDSTTLLGSILRLDVGGGIPYAVPPDNPFVGRSGADEIWAYGLRNPWRMSFDRGTHDLYIADVGQNIYEEINVQPSSSAGGENYGWRRMEASHCYNPSTSCDNGGLIYPITEYSHSDGCSITGGIVYRGCHIPDLRGTYFYGDWCNGRIWSFRYNGTTITDSLERTAELAPGGTRTIDNISSFGEDIEGELYILDHGDGEVYRVIPAEAVEPDCGTVGCCDKPGDANDDSSINVGDAVYLINYIFKGGPAPPCSAEADVNVDCALNVGDAVYLVEFIFQGGAPPECSDCV